MTLANIYFFIIPNILIILLVSLLYFLISKKITADLLLKNNELRLIELDKKIEDELEQYHHNFLYILQKNTDNIEQNFSTFKKQIKEQNEEITRLKNEVKKRDNMLIQRHKKIQKLKAQNANNN